MTTDKVSNYHFASLKSDFKGYLTAPVDKHRPQKNNDLFKKVLSEKLSSELYLAGSMAQLRVSLFNFDLNPPSSGFVLAGAILKRIQRKVWCIVIHSNHHN